MSEYEGMLHNMVTAASTDLRSLVTEVGDEFDLSIAEVIQMGRFLTAAWIAGAKAGQAEMVAQAIEQGIDVRN